MLNRRFRGRAARLAPGTMNKTEAKYADHLEALRIAGKVLWFKFEAIKLRLASNTFYTPDFLVMAADESLELHEVKGHWEDDARVKIKVVAEQYPFRVLAVTYKRGDVCIEEFGNKLESEAGHE